MLEILPIEDKILQESLCLRFGVNFNTELMAYAAYIDGKPAGICQFTVNSNIGILTDLAVSGDTQNEQVLFALGIAALNFMDICDAHTVKCQSENIDGSILLSLGFTQKSDGMYENKISGA